MSPKLFLVHKQQKQMKAELAASRQLHKQHQAEYAAGCLGAHALHETLHQVCICKHMYLGIYTGMPACAVAAVSWWTLQ